MSYFDNAQVTFDERYKETIDFLLSCSNLINSRDGSISRDNEHIIKSNITIMQYNILESSFLELYSEFYQILQRCNLSLDSLNNQFTYTIYCMIKRASKDKYKRLQDKLFSTDSNMTSLNFSNHAMSTCFELDDEERKFLVNGNLDGKKVKDFFKKFGINITSLEALNLGSLKTLKDNRQLLAHGGSSFVEVGRTISWDDLQENQKIIKNLFDESKNILINFCNDMIKMPPQHAE